ncbi:MAG: protease modulator HflC [Pseudomonadota bacterium]
MGQNKGMVFLVGVGVLALILSSTLYTVEQQQTAILFQLGEIKRDDLQPGLHWKLPVINNVRKFDGRIQTMDAPPERFLTSEKKNVIVDAFVKWRISDVSRFYTSTGGGDVKNANLRLSQIIKDGLRDEFGKRTIQEVISGERNQIMDVLTVKANKQAEELGVQVVQVRIRRIDLPPEVSTSVFQRMEAERQRVAKDLRSKGMEAAERIRAEADRDRTVILAEAFRDAEQLRGEGDAKASEIYAKAYDRDREFYALYRSLEAYRATFQSKDDILVLDPKSEFFKYLESASGR